MIVVADVHQRRGGRTILAGVDVDVPPGTCTALAGGNGASKSSLLGAMVALAPVDRGSIRIAGHDPADRRARARLAYLPECFQPPAYLTGGELLRTMRRLYGQPPDDSAIAAASAELGLSATALDRPVAAYSKGMVQLLGLAGCLLSERPLLILDEPMSGLDPGARLRLRAALARRAAAGATVLFTTHLLADAERFADWVAILDTGRIVAAASPAELRARYGCADLERAVVANLGLGVAGSACAVGPDGAACADPPTRRGRVPGCGA